MPSYTISSFRRLLQSPLTWSCYRHYCEQRAPAERKEGISDSSDVVKTKFEGASVNSQEVTEKPPVSWWPFSVSVDTMGYLSKKNAFTLEGLAELAGIYIWKSQIEEQQYKPERHKILGPDLATAHFLVGHGGAIRFSDHSEWVKKDKSGVYELPDQRVPDLFVEDIDASNTNLMCAGFDNLVFLSHLKSLKLRNCQNVDDWCLDKLHIFSKTPLEYLDISECPLITENGLCSLHKLRNLKTLVVEDLPGVKHKDLVCMMINDYLPNLNIVGSNYLEDQI